MPQLIWKCVMSCEQSIKESGIDNRLIRPALQKHSEHITGPEDVMQFDLVQEIHPSGGYQDIVTAMDVFSNYLFAYLTKNQDARLVATVTIFIKNTRTYMPTSFCAPNDQNVAESP